MKSTATATLAAAALWLSGTIATIPALADDGDPGPLTAEEVLAEDEANGISPDAPYPPYQPEGGDANGEIESVIPELTPWGPSVPGDEVAVPLPRDDTGNPVIDRPLGEGLDPTPDQLEQWAAEDAEFQAQAQADLDELLAEMDAEYQGREDNDYLLEKWRESDSEQSFGDWLEAMDSESSDWSDDFEEWGDDDWDVADGDGDQAGSAGADTRSAEEIRADTRRAKKNRADRIRRVARSQRAEDALRDEWKRSGSDLPYDEWHEQTYPPTRLGSGDWSDDFEEWGDDDWDDTVEPDSEGNTQDSAWMEDLDAMSAGLMPGGAGVDDPSALVDLIADDDEAIAALAWPDDGGLATAMGERDRLEAVRDSITAGTPVQTGDVGAAISESGSAAAPGRGVVLTAGPSEFSE